MYLQINCWCTVWWGGVGPPHFSSPTSWSARTWRWSTPSSMWRNAGGSSPTGASWNSSESWTCTSWRAEGSLQSRADCRTRGASWASGQASGHWSWMSSHLRSPRKVWSHWGEIKASGHSRQAQDTLNVKLKSSTSETISSQVWVKPKETIHVYIDVSQAPGSGLPRVSS